MIMEALEKKLDEDYWLDNIINHSKIDEELLSLTYNVANYFPSGRKGAIYQAVSTAVHEHIDPKKAKEGGLITCYLLTIGQKQLNELPTEIFKKKAIEIGIEANHAGTNVSIKKLNNMLKYAKTATYLCPYLKEELELDMLKSENMVLKAQIKNLYGIEGITEMDQMSAKLTQRLKSYATQVMSP